MNMFAKFDEIPAMTLQDIKKTRRHRRRHGRTQGRTHAPTIQKKYTYHKQILRGGGGGGGYKNQNPQRNHDYDQNIQLTHGTKNKVYNNIFKLTKQISVLYKYLHLH